MLYLQKNEIVNDIKKIIKEAGNHQDIVNICKEALEALEKYKEESIKEYIKSNYVIVQCFLYTLEKKKNCLGIVIDYVYTFLANSVLSTSSLKEITRILSQKTTWSEHEKMKILQMSFYLVRHDEFCGDSAVDLLKYLCLLIDDHNKQISNTAKPITIQIIDYLFNKIETSKETPSLDDQDKTTAEEGVVDIDILIDSMKSKSTEFSPAESVSSETYSKDGINILQTVYDKRNSSKNLSMFYCEIITLIAQKNGIFKVQSFYDFFSVSVFEDIKTKLQEGSKEEKEKFIQFLEIICKTHSDIFAKEIDKLLGVVELISAQKDCQYILPLVLSLDQNILKGHEETILFNLLKTLSFSTSTDEHLGVVYKLSELLKHDVKVYEKYSVKLVEIYKNTKNADKEDKVDLIGKIFEFTLQSGNIDMFDNLIQIFKGKKMEDVLFVECVKNRDKMKDTWEMVFENVQNNLEVLVSSLNVFTSEEVFFLIRSLTSNPTRWPLNETLVFYTSIFEGISAILKNQDNIKILDLYTVSLICLLNSTDNKDERLLILSKYCQMILGYASGIEKPTLEVEKTLGEMLRKVLSLNVTHFGPLVLQTLHTLLRIFIPENWENTFLIIDMCSISSLHQDLFKTLSLIVSKYLDLIGTDQYLILFSCIEDVCSSSDDELSNRAMMSMLEIGECIISKRIVKGTDYNLWKFYLTTLHQFTNDSRHKIRDKSLRYLFQFIFSDSALVDSNELDFVVKETLIPLVKSRTNTINTIMADPKLYTSLIILLEELNRHDCLKFDNLDYLDAQLQLIENILKYERILEHQNLIDMCLVPLTIRILPPCASIQMFQDDASILFSMKRNRITFGNPSCKEEDIVERLFKFYQRLFEGFEEYPPYVFILLLDGIRRFSPEVITEHINMFDKALKGSNEILLNKLVSTLFSINSNEGLILNYLLEFVIVNESLASLILPNCANKLKKVGNTETVLNFMTKVYEAGEIYDSLWELSLSLLLEGSKYVSNLFIYDRFVDVSTRIFNRALKEDIVDGNVDDINCSTFQVYTNKQFSHYLEHEPVDCTIKANVAKKISINRTVELRKRERLLLNYLVVYYTTISNFVMENHLDCDEVRKGFKLVLNLTQIKNNRPFCFYNLSFKSYHLLFINTALVYHELHKILKKVLKNYNEEEKVNNMLFSSIKQKEIYLVFELLIESKNQTLIDNLKIEMLNCLKNKDFNVVEYVRKSFMVLFGQ